MNAENIHSTFAVPGALNPETVKIDERSVADHLRFAVQLAELVNFYDKENRHNGNWRRFLEKDPVIFTAVLAGTNYRKNYALFSRIKPLLEATDSADIVASFAPLFDLMQDIFDELKNWAAITEGGKDDYELKTFLLERVNSSEFRNDETQMQELKGSVLTVEKADDDAFLRDEQYIELKILYSKIFSFYTQVISNAEDAFGKLVSGENPYPDTTLLIVFLKLLESHKDQLNELTKKHLDFYYRDILQQSPREPEPDEAFLSLALKKEIEPFFLPEGTKFYGGLDGEKQEIIYESQADLLLDQMELGDVFTLYRDSQDRLFREKIETPDQIKKQDDGAINTWKTFGEAQEQHAIQNGFAIASPMLYLEQGHREIHIEFLLTGVYSTEAFDKAICSLSTTDGWYDTDFQIEIPDSLGPHPAAGNWFKIHINLNAADPAVLPFEKDPDGLSRKWPGLKIILSKDASQPGSLELENFFIFTGVQKMTKLDIYNNSAKLNSSESFLPLGNTPLKGDRFYLGNKELFAKPLTSFDFRWDWKGLPKNFAEYYKEYNGYLGENSTPLPEPEPQVFLKLNEISEDNKTLDSGEYKYNARLINYHRGDGDGLLEDELFDRVYRIHTNSSSHILFGPEDDTRGPITSFTVSGWFFFESLNMPDLFQYYADGAKLGLRLFAFRNKPAGLFNEFQWQVRRGNETHQVNITGLNEWHFLSVSIASSAEIFQIKMFVNGKLAYESESSFPSFPIWILPEYGRIGHVGAGYINPGFGPHDDDWAGPEDANNSSSIEAKTANFRIYNRVLPPAEVSEQYALDKFGTTFYHNEAFQIRFELRDKAEWKEFPFSVARNTSPASDPTSLFKNAQTLESELAYYYHKDHLRPGQMQISADPELLFENEFKANEAPGGFINFSLTNPEEGFGQKLFPEVLTKTATDNALIIAKIAAGVLDLTIAPPASPPFVPEAENLELNYESVWSHEPYDKGDGFPFELYHYGLFENYKVYDSNEPENQERVNSQGPDIFPNFKEHGALYIGLKNVEAPRRLSLYLELSEEAHSGKSGADSSRSIKYRYLSDELENSEPVQPWKDLAVLSDSTEGMTCSGILLCDIPANIAASHPSMPAGMSWISISVSSTSNLPGEDNLAGFVKSIYLNNHGVKVKRTGNNYLPQGEKPTLEAEQIKKTLEPKPEIKAVVQPFPSSGGRAAENENDFYKRVSSRIRNKDRVSSLEDYRMAALAAHPELYFALPSLVPNKPGEVCLGLVQGYKKAQDVDAYRPNVDSCARARIKNYIQGRVSPFVKIEVFNLKQVEIRISCDIQFRTPGIQKRTIKELNQELRLFLSPWISSEKTQIEAAVTLRKEQIQSFLYEFPEVLDINNLKFYKSASVGGGTVDIENENPIEIEADSIFVSAMNHEIEANNE